MPTVNLQWNYNTGEWEYWNNPETPISSGWIDWTPPLGTIYVSDSLGSDTYDGTAQTHEGGTVGPKKTIAAGLAASSDGYHVLLRRGDVFSEDIDRYAWNTGTPTNNFVFAYYGDANHPRPVISYVVTGFSIIFINWQVTVDNLIIDGIKLTNPAFDEGDPAFNPTGVVSLLTLKGGHDNIVVQDCVFERGEVIVQPDNNTFVTNLTFNRNIWTGAFHDGTTDSATTKKPSNLFVDGTGTENLVITENTFSMGGWNETRITAGANFFCHNLYLTDFLPNTVSGSGNFIVKAAGNGMTNRQGGVWDNNFYGRNTLSHTFGYDKDGAPEMQAGYKGYLLNCVSSEQSSYYKGASLADIVSDTTNRTGASYGFQCNQAGTNIGADIQITNCIVAHRDPVYSIPNVNISKTPILISIDTDSIGVEINNIEYHVTSPTQGDGPSYTDPTRTGASYYTSVISPKIPSLISSGFIDSTPVVPDDFDKLVEVFTQRNLRKWDDDVTAYLLNDYIRIGFDKAPIGVPQG